LMELMIEHIMNIVKEKNLPLTCAIAVAANRRSSAHERLDHSNQLKRSSRYHARLDRNARFPL